MSETGLDLAKLSIEKRKLYVPDNEAVISALNVKLRENFAQVDVTLIDCPDLTQSPFNLAAPGLGGNECIFDIGGDSFLLPTPTCDKIYDLRSIINLTNDQKTFVVGAGAGPWPFAKTNCELVANAVIEKEEMQINSSRLVKIKDRKDVKIETLPKTESRFCFLGNMYSCRGEPGKVFQIRCKKRTGSLDFATAIREALGSSFPDQIIGMGGVFIILEGETKLHIMDDFSCTPIKTRDDLNKWLTFHEISAPLINVGTMVSKDPGLKLRPHHFHCFGPNGGGHYHYDTTPNDVEYLACFSFGRTLYRIDCPTGSFVLGFN